MIKALFIGFFAVAFLSTVFFVLFGVQPPLAPLAWVALFLALVLYIGR
jgi:putative exporter of polyketide antibiotics